MTTMLPDRDTEPGRDETTPSASADGIAGRNAEETQPLTQTAPPLPEGPAPSRGHDRPEKRGRGATQLGATALIAALLASGATLAVDRTLNDGAGAGAEAPAAVSAIVDGEVSWTAVASAVTPSVVSIGVTGAGGTGEGSGVVWDDAGHIVTNEHVVSGAGNGAEVTVKFGDGHTYRATVVGTDPTTDLAVLEIVNPPADLTPITRGDSSALQVGDPVMAVGNPLGLSGTVTTGIVSALNRPVAAGQAQSQGSLPQVTNAIQTSAPINPGNSGGALVDAQGRLIGINSSIATLGSASPMAQAGNIGIGFAIPVKEVENIASQLISTGGVQHAYLGINVSGTTVERGTATISGALVVDTVDGGPAALAGLQADDVIVEVAGTPVSGSEGLIGAIRGLSVGETVSLTVIRGSSELTVDVTLAAAPTR